MTVDPNQAYATGNTFRVTQNIEGAHPKHPSYPLLPGDILVYNEADRTYGKISPGLALLGFMLSPEQASTLERVSVTVLEPLVFGIAPL